MQGFTMTKAQQDAFRDVWCRMIYEMCGSIPLAMTEHPRAKQLFNLIGVPPVSRKYLAGAKLDEVHKQVVADMGNPPRI